MKTKLQVNLSKATCLWRKKYFTLNYPQAYFTREMIKKVPMKRPNNSVCGWHDWSYPTENTSLRFILSSDMIYIQKFKDIH